MSKLDDLHTLVRLLKEFEFPVSPLLEYAIKEKIEQLSSEGESPVVMPVVEVQENDGMFDVSVFPKKKLSVLRIVRADGTSINCKKAADTLCQAIIEIGVEKVYSLKIPVDGMYLVNIGGNPKYPSAQHDVGNGYFVNVHSNTSAKKRMLEKIFSALNLNWKVDIVEPNLLESKS